MQTTRRVHEAMMETVEQRGATAPRALYAAYERFNEEHFGGQLGAPFILIGACSSARALGDYIGQDVHGLESRIRIAERAVSAGRERAEWVLLHEMIHAWCHEIAKDGEPGYRGHGPKFAGKCNEIGAKYGFREVAAKGKRKGMPDCAQWPFSAMDASPGEDAGGEKGEGEGEGAGETSAPRALCLHCGKKPAKVPGEAARFCGGKCARAWLVAETAPLGWCAEHGWKRPAENGGACSACAEPASARHLRCA